MAVTTNNNWVVLSSFVAGIATTFLASKISNNGKNNRKNEGATAVGEDLSLFYGNIDELTTITAARKFLPEDLYAKLVRDCVVFCVDIVLVRTTKIGRKECLLVKRSSEPVKGVWWWPGGRMLKGETFFDAAKRKASQETGLTDVTCVQVLGIWNTFFPTSNWDTENEKGTQTVNAIVLVELDSVGVDVALDDTSEDSRWISLDPEDAEKNGEDKYVLQGLLRLHSWNPTYHKR
jgi:colanic acid biosynthesis protein WcaH